MNGRIALLLLLLTACATTPSPRVQVVGDVRFTELGAGVWLHSSYKDIAPWGPTVSHGVVVLRGDSALLVDTAWDDSQTASILAWAAEQGKPVVAAVVTHAHDDKMGGLGLLSRRGIQTFAHPLSNELAPGRGLHPADHGLEFDEHGLAREPVLPGLTLMYPGPGHTSDNIVVSIDDTPFLFGGCLIRPAESTSLGNTADADLASWGSSVRKVAKAFPRATVIIPSHGAPGGRALLGHTESLARP